MINEVEKIIKLQSIDAHMDALRKEIAQLPIQIASIEKTLESHQSKLEADKGVLAGNQTARRQAEGEVQMEQQKISKLRDQMLSAKTNEQYRAFQHEIDYCDKQIRSLEDRILTLMLESEELDTNVTAAEQALVKEKEQVERMKAAARERTAVDQKKLEELAAERSQVTDAVSKAMLGHYDRLSKKHPGSVVSDATDGRCKGCHLELRPQLYQDLRKADTLLFCENCKRILYYNPPVEFDTAVGAPTPGGPRQGTRVDMT